MENSFSSFSEMKTLFCIGILFESFMTRYAAILPNSHGSDLYCRKQCLLNHTSFMENRNAEKGLQKCIGKNPLLDRCQHLNKMLQF